ncbi:unnamed protein product [Caenorhabditis sp. 36 PRJEB53466]|nr:unnamed protein product [Caenorhabditis sp. 36 PRJEB53466]
MISSETIQLSLNLDHISEVDFGRLERRQRFRSRSVGHQRSDHNMLSRWASAISLEEINEYGKWKVERAQNVMEQEVNKTSHCLEELEEFRSEKFRRTVLDGLGFVEDWSKSMEFRTKVVKLVMETGAPEKKSKEERAGWTVRTKLADLSAFQFYWGVNYRRGKGEWYETTQRSVRPDENSRRPNSSDDDSESSDNGNEFTTAEIKPQPIKQLKEYTTFFKGCLSEADRIIAGYRKKYIAPRIAGPPILNRHNSFLKAILTVLNFRKILFAFFLTTFLKYLFNPEVIFALLWGKSPVSQEFKAARGKFAELLKYMFDLTSVTSCIHELDNSNISFSVRECLDRTSIVLAKEVLKTLQVPQPTTHSPEEMGISQLTIGRQRHFVNAATDDLIPKYGPHPRHVFKTIAKKFGFEKDWQSNRLIVDWFNQFFEAYFNQTENFHEQLRVKVKNGTLDWKMKAYYAHRLFARFWRLTRHGDVEAMSFQTQTAVFRNFAVERKVLHAFTIFAINARLSREMRQHVVTYQLNSQYMVCKELVYKHFESLLVEPSGIALHYELNPARFRIYRNEKDIKQGMISSETIKQSLNLDRISRINLRRVKKNMYGPKFRSRSVGHQRSDHNMLSRWASAISLKEINEYGKWKVERAQNVMEQEVNKTSHCLEELEEFRSEKFKRTVLDGLGFVEDWSKSMEFRTKVVKLVMETGAPEKKSKEERAGWTVRTKLADLSAFRFYWGVNYRRGKGEWYETTQRSVRPDEDSSEPNSSDDDSESSDDDREDESKEEVKSNEIAPEPFELLDDYKSFIEDMKLEMRFIKLDYSEKYTKKKVDEFGVVSQSTNKYGVLTRGFCKILHFKFVIFEHLLYTFSKYLFNPEANCALLWGPSIHLKRHFRVAKTKFKELLKEMSDCTILDKCLKELDDLKYYAREKDEINNTTSIWTREMIRAVEIPQSMTYIPEEIEFPSHSVVGRPINLMTVAINELIPPYRPHGKQVFKTLAKKFGFEKDWQSKGLIADWFNQFFEAYFNQTENFHEQLRVKVKNGTLDWKMKAYYAHRLFTRFWRLMRHESTEAEKFQKETIEFRNYPSERKVLHAFTIFAINARLPKERPNEYVHAFQLHRYYHLSRTLLRENYKPPPVDPIDFVIRYDVQPGRFRVYKIKNKDRRSCIAKARISRKRPAKKE